MASIILKPFIIKQNIGHQLENMTFLPKRAKLTLQMPM